MPPNTHAEEPENDRPVLVERDGPVTPCSEPPGGPQCGPRTDRGALAHAFRAFDADPRPAVAILTGTPAATAPSPPETPEYVDNFRSQA
jgi:hypothetical protein